MAVSAKSVLAEVIPVSNFQHAMPAYSVNNPVICQLVTDLSSLPSVELKATAPVRKELIALFQESILSLKLLPGQLLPSTRELSDQLGISRATCVRAYNDLTAKGFIETIEGVGTFVRKRLVIEPKVASTSGYFPLAQYSRTMLELPSKDSATANDHRSASFTDTPAELLPVAEWRNALLECSNQFNPTREADCPDYFGNRLLREAICAYLSRSSMIDCPIEQLLVFTAPTQLVKAVAELLIDPGDTIAFPNPGPDYQRTIFKSLQANIVFLDSDEQGLDVPKLMMLPQAPKLVYLNSAHSDPTGVPLSLARRKLLAQWSAANSVIILEDDCDAELRYAGSRMPPVKALSDGDNVIYISSFNRTLYPLIDASYMIAPRSMLSVLSKACQLFDRSFHTHLSFFDQQAMTNFLNNGKYEKYLHRVRSVYAARWRALVYQLTLRFSKDVKLSNESSSSHLFVQFSDRFSDDLVRECARQSDLPLISARHHFEGAAPAGAFLIAFAHLSELEIAKRVETFRQCLS
jgi:GntR family transcriptional regulator / MocR family aminotransferase